MNARTGGQPARPRGRRVAAVLLAAAIAGTLAAGCGPSGGGGSKGGGGNSSGGNGSGNGGSGGNGSGQGTPSPVRVSYMLAGPTQVELLAFSVSGSGEVTGSFAYEYNCGDGHDAINQQLSVSGTQVSSTTVDLEFSGIDAQFTGTSDSAGLELSGPGGSEQFTLIGGDATPQGALSQIPAISSVSGYSCTDLPPDDGP